MRNAAYLLFTGNDKAIRTGYSTKSVTLLGAAVGLNRVIVFLIAIVVLAALHL